MRNVASLSALRVGRCAPESNSVYTKNTKVSRRTRRKHMLVLFFVSFVFFVVQSVLVLTVEGGDPD
jgi:hypothetical protein